MNILSLGNASLLIATLRAVADYVVIDTPPLLRSADAYPFLQLADVVVAVCRERGTSQAEAHETRSILASLGVSRFSVVLSESTSAKSRYGYYGYGESET
jgi:Mrp family chromosome partitioning ATPase